MRHQASGMTEVTVGSELPSSLNHPSRHAPHPRDVRQLEGRCISFRQPAAALIDDQRVAHLEPPLT